MKAIKPLRFHLLLIFLVFLFLLLFFRNKSYESSSVDKQAQEIDFPKSSLEPDSLAKSDPFTNKDFVGKKLLKLVSLTHDASTPQSSDSFPKIDEGKNANKRNLSKSDAIDFSYILNELISTVHLQNFLSQSWGCKEVDSIKIKNVLYETKRNTVYGGAYKNKEVAVQVTKSNSDVLMNVNCGLTNPDRTQQNLDQCFLLKHRQLFDEIALLTQLSHSNIVGILGLCVKRRDFIDQAVPTLSSSSEVILLKEGGDPTSLKKLNLLSWNDRLQVCLDLLSLAIYFENTPLKSLRLESWKPNNFIMHSVNRKILLSNFDQLVFPLEPSCVSDNQCAIAGTDLGISCILRRCAGYNAKKNFFELTHEFLMPLLMNKVHPKLSETVSDISVALKDPKINPTDLAKEIQQLLQKAQSETFIKFEPGQLEMNKPDISFVKEKHFPEGWQVDSWEEHESKVAINEVDASKVHKHEPVKVKANRFDGGVALKSLDDNEKDDNGFIKYENADFPGRYDYKCPKSRANWGCMGSLHSVKDAMRKCLNDVNCKAFVVMPHQRKEAMTDAEWTNFVKESTVTGASRFKPAYGRLAKGGQMNVVLKSKSKDFSAFFLAKRGPRDLDVSHSAVYQLDRMLGLYRTIPAVEKRLSPSQLLHAGFPTDIGGNRFDCFRSLKLSDGSLIGVVVPQVLERVVTEHHISVPALSGITSAVTPFSRRQLDDLEYLLLGFLADIPTPSRGHKKVKGQLLHLKTEQAFRPNSNNYISYLYNCQFPSDVIKTLRHVYSQRCSLSWTMQATLTDSHLTHIAKSFQANMIRLLNLVDNCIARFGRRAVIYS